jgi:YD repeat-containing protein
VIDLFQEGLTTEESMNFVIRRKDLELRACLRQIARVLHNSQCFRTTWAVRLLILALLITHTPPANIVRASEDGDERLQKKLDNVRRDLQDAYAAYIQKLADERWAEMRESWDAFDEARAKKFESLLSTVPRSPIIGPRFSSNMYGANYEVPYGKYSGNGLVGLQEVDTDIAGAAVPTSRTITRGQQGLQHRGSGWNFEPGGMLKETYLLLSASVAGSLTQCSIANRLEYLMADTGIEFLNKGIEQPCDFYIQGQNPDSCMPSAPSRCDANRPTQYWSTDGQVALDATDRNAPVLLFPDGGREILGPKAAGAYLPFNKALRDYSNAASINGLWFTDKSITTNGYITSYNYDSGSGWLTSVTDPKGRVSEYVRGGDGLVTSVTAPGPGAGRLTWQMTWNTLTWNPAATFPDIQCLIRQDTPTPCPSNLSYKTLTSLQIPDGRSYAFTYGPWGNLNVVNTPEGSATVFDYGTSGTPTFQAPRVGTAPGYTLSLDQRHLTAITVYPQGTSKPGFTTHVDHERTDTLPNGSGNFHCTTLNWVKRTYADGNIMREAQCPIRSTNSAYDRTFAQEVWQGNSKLMGTYYGNTGNLGDSATAVGDMYLDWEQSGTFAANSVDLDVRPTKVIHIKDGVKWMEKFGYEFSTIPVPPRCSTCSSYRTMGNVLTSQILDGGENLLATTSTTYYHSLHPQYLNRNLLRLRASVTLSDAVPTDLTRTEYEYDEYGPYPLMSSGAQNLDTSIGVRRGNETTVRNYKDAANALAPITSHKSYFDTGDVREIYDANPNPPSLMTYDFALCTTVHKSLSNTVKNSKGHQTITVADCNSGLTLSTTDPNNQTTYSQYDELGRIVETASPGDTLTRLPPVVPNATPTAGSPHYVRDPNIPTGRTNGGINVGNGGQGPTTWFEYLALGVIEQQRVVIHTKDGTTNGRYVKTFTDGLGRTIQTRSEVDPNTSSGNGEVKVTTEYDSLGRLSKNHVPLFAAASDSYEAPGIGALATVTTYDALGRVKSVTAPGPRTVTTDYGNNSGSLFTTTVTDARSNRKTGYTDILGHKVQVSEQSSNCTGGWCVTQMNYDAAGRLLGITDPSWNQTTFIYDSLGRKMHMTDLDMGTWDYDYDDNGNLTYQKDAKGQIILMAYDALNRVMVKDLPPNRSNPAAAPGPEDTTYFYDGEH